MSRILPQPWVRSQDRTSAVDTSHQITELAKDISKQYYSSRQVMGKYFALGFFLTCFIPKGM